MSCLYPPCYTLFPENIGRVRRVLKHGFFGKYLFSNISHRKDMVFIRKNKIKNQEK